MGDFDEWSSGRELSKTMRPLGAPRPGDVDYVLPFLRDPVHGGPYKLDQGADVDDMLAQSMADSIAKRRAEEERGLMDATSECVAEFPSRGSRGARQLYPEGTQARAAFDLATGAAKGIGGLIEAGHAAKTKAIMDPETAVEEAKQFGTKIVEGDPQAQDEALIAASMSMVPGVQDAADVELARRDVKKAVETREPSDIAMAGVSTVFAAIPLVGVGLTKKITKGAPDASEIAKLDADELFPERFQTTDGYKFYKVKTEDGFEYRDSLDPDAYDMSVKPEEIREMFRMSGDMPIPEDLSTALWRTIDAKQLPETIDTPVFESVLEKVVVEKAPNKLGINDVEKFLEGKGVKKSEIADTKVPDFVAAAKAEGKKSVTKDELIQHLEDNKVQIEEVRLGASRMHPDVEDALEEVNVSHAQVQDASAGFVDEIRSIRELRKENPGKAQPTRPAGSGVVDKEIDDATFWHELRTDPTSTIGNTINPAIEEAVFPARLHVKSMLNNWAGGINVSPVSRKWATQQGMWDTYEELTDAELRRMISANDHNADLRGLDERDDLLELAKSYDKDSPADERLIDWWNMRNARFADNINDMQGRGILDVEDADFLDNLYINIQSPGTVDFHFNPKIVTPEKVKEIRSHLADMKQRYSTVEDARFADRGLSREAFIADLDHFDQIFKDFEGPHGVLAERAAALRFLNEGDMLKLGDAQNELRRLSEKHKGEPGRFEELVVARGSQYREILLTVPDESDVNRARNMRANQIREEIDQIQEEIDQHREGRLLSLLAPEESKKRFTELQEESKKRFTELQNELDMIEKKIKGSRMGTGAFRRTHFSDVPNVFAHVRLNTRTDTQGRRVLFVEEIQSDWHQKGREYGYKSEVPKKMVPFLEAMKDFEKAAEEESTFRMLNPKTPRVQRGNDIWEELEDGLYSRESLSPEGAEELRAFERFNQIWSERQAGGLSVMKAQNRVREEASKLGVSIVSARSDLPQTTRNIHWGFTTGGTNVIPNEDIVKHVTEKVSSRAIPDAPFKDTKEWTSLAVRRILRMAADEGYDGVAFTRGDMITPIVTLDAVDGAAYVGHEDEFRFFLESHGMDSVKDTLDGNKYFYDKLLPSIAKKESKGKLATTRFDVTSDYDLDHGEHNVVDVPFIELTPKVKEKVSKPQKLYEAVIGAGAGGAAAKSLREEGVADDEET